MGRFRDEFLDLLDKDVNILFANEDEARALFEAEDFDGVIAAARKWGGIAAITRSAHGCVVAGRWRGTCDPRRACVPGRGYHRRRRPVRGRLFVMGSPMTKAWPIAAGWGAIAAAEVISHYGARPETSLKDLAAKASLL